LLRGIPNLPDEMQARVDLLTQLQVQEVEVLKILLYLDGQEVSNDQCETYCTIDESKGVCIIVRLFP